MNLLEGCRDFLLREREAAEAEEQVEGLLTPEALVERGLAVGGLRVARRSRGELVLACDVNESRLRPGGRVSVEGDELSFPATIRDIQDGGRTFLLEVQRDVLSLADGPWMLQESGIDLTPTLLACLQKFQAGAPGWSYMRVLTGQMPQIPTLLRQSETSRAADAVESACGVLDHPLDASQRQALGRCVEQPLALGVQGPPGTGKTKVLAVVAETLARLGKRVLVVAPTHQAVNNALSTIHAHFPQRRVVKIGDRLQRNSLAPDIPYMFLRELGRELPGDVVRETILGMTAVSALFQFALKSSGLAPNVILVDEAGQLPLATGVCLGLIGAGSVLLFGDDAQLPPVFPSRMQDDPLAVSLFARLRASHPAAILTLNTTYRLNRDICDVVASNFYGDMQPSPLSPSPQASERRLRLALLPESCASAGVRALGSECSVCWVKFMGSDDKQDNPAEAVAAVDVVLACLGNGLRATDVAVVTPYRRQAAAIRRLLQQHLPPAGEMPIVDTVERVQGLTVEVIVISFCTSDPDHAAGVANFLFSPNRLNVAISRARTKVILLGSETLFSAIPGNYQDLLNQQRVRAVFRLARPHELP